jgi:amidohydrolase
MNIKERAEFYNDYIIEQRRFFHERPELSFEETETTAAIKKQLEGMDIAVTTFPDYQGLVGVIKGGKPGKPGVPCKTVMLRADIDALPVEEHTGLPFASKNPGKMHACGHDNHIAMLLGAAKILAENKAEISGEVRLLFQSAEESGTGAHYYIDNKTLDGVDALLGIHIWNGAEAHKFSLEGGPQMAAFNNFTITVKGESAHAVEPHLGHDAVVAAASIIMNLQTFVSRMDDPVNPLVVTVGTIHGGQRFNIIGNKVVMEGTMRSYSSETCKTIPADFRRIVENTARAFGCTAEITCNAYLPAVDNTHEELNALVRAAAVKLYGESSLVNMKKTMGSEDFSLYMQQVPAFYGFIGSHSAAQNKIYPNHNDKYDVDESVLHKGAALYAQFAWDFLAG